MNFNIDQPIKNPEQARAHEVAANLQKIHALVQAEMAAAQYRHAEAYDKGQLVLTTVRPRFAPRFAKTPHQNFRRN